MKMSLRHRLRMVQLYYSLFAFRGVWLTAKALLFRRPVEVLVEVFDLKRPVHIRLATSDVFTFNEIFRMGEYRFEFSKDPRVVVDAGANIGLASVAFANRYPRAKIIALEPEASNYRMLQKNTAPYPNVTPVRGALWKCNQQIRLIDPGLGQWGFQTVDESQPGGTANIDTVAGVTVDGLMADHGVEYIDILKVNIEGSEKEVFEDASRWIDRVGVVEVDLHDRFRRGCSRSVYLATKDFEFESREVDAIVLARKEYVANGTLQPATAVKFSCTNGSRQSQHFKINRTAKNVSVAL